MSTLLTRPEALEFLRQHGFAKITKGFFLRISAPGSGDAGPPFIQVRAKGRCYLYRDDALLEWARRNLVTTSCVTLRPSASTTQRRRKKQDSLHAAAA